MSADGYERIPGALDFCGKTDSFDGCPVRNDPQLTEHCRAMEIAAGLIRELCGDLDRERVARVIVDKAVRQLVKENRELKEKNAQLKDQYDPEVVQILDGERMRSISNSALLSLLRAWDEDRLVVLPVETDCMQPF